MDRCESVLRVGLHDMFVDVRGRSGVLMGEWIVQLYANLASDPPPRTEDTKPKAKVDGFPLALNNHRAGTAVR